MKTMADHLPWIQPWAILLVSPSTCLGKKI